MSIMLFRPAVGRFKSIRQLLYMCCRQAAWQLLPEKSVRHMMPFHLTCVLFLLLAANPSAEVISWTGGQPPLGGRNTAPQAAFVASLAATANAGPGRYSWPPSAWISMSLAAGADCIFGRRGVINPRGIERNIFVDSLSAATGRESRTARNSCTRCSSRSPLRAGYGRGLHRLSAVGGGTVRDGAGEGASRSTRLQVSASFADQQRTVGTGAAGRRGKVGGSATGAGGAGTDLAAAPVERIENIDQYFRVLQENADSIVVMKVFAGFCRACKAFDRKYRQLAIDYDKAEANIKFYDMDWMENRDLCKSLQVKKLPHIELYAGKRGRLESFVCGPSKAGLLAEKLDILLRDPSDPSLGSAAGVPPVGHLGSNEFTDVRDIDTPNRATL